MIEQQYQCFVQWQPDKQDYGVFLFVRESAARVPLSLVRGPEIKRHGRAPEIIDAEAAGGTNVQMLQCIVDAAYEAGIRPTGLSGESGATQAHLEDMRSISDRLLKKIGA